MLKRIFLAAFIIVASLVVVNAAKADGTCRIDGAHSPETLVDVTVRNSPMPPDDVEELTPDQVEKVLKLIGWEGKPTGFEVEKIGLIKYPDGSAIIYFERGDTCVLSFSALTSQEVSGLRKKIGSATNL